MADPTPAESIVLLIRLGSGWCATPLESVAEVMRPLPLQPIPGVPSFILGLAVVRGFPVPVVDLGAVVGATTGAPVGRFVLLNLGGRKAAVAVEEVLGVRRLGDTVLPGLPPLLKDAGREMVEGLGVRDGQLLVVLRTTRVIPDDVWKTLEAKGPGER